MIRINHAYTWPRRLRCWPRRLRCIGVAAVAALLICTTARAGDSYHWLQITADGLEARAITQETSCPRATIDGAETYMSVRAPPDRAFPILVCALSVPRTVTEAAIEGRPLALPPKRVDKMLLIGDTGCRLKSILAQDCNSIKAWPFRLVADLSAEMSPDLVLHLGDLLYREAACPAIRKGCAGSPFGDNWAAWKADFFEPAGALLPAAPWIFVRGNHENCRRAHEGWSRFFAPGPYEPGVCRAQDPAYSVDLGGLTLVVMDLIESEERAIDETRVKIYREQFEKLASIKGPLWIATHKPIYGSFAVLLGVSQGDNKTLAAAARGVLPANLQAILSGHLHLFEVVSYVEDFPAQIISGHGGDYLDPFPPKKFDGVAINDVTVEVGRSAPPVFGFATLQRGEGEWIVTGYDAHATSLIRCRMQARKLKCE
jgi:hypothetical protein